jgi:hypothetical protein
MEPRLREWATFQSAEPISLHWAVNYWHQNPPGTDVDFPVATEWNAASFNDFYGDGQLVYPSPDGGLLASIRLEAIRDGIEDAEYFALLCKNDPTGRQRIWLTNQLNRLVRSHWEWNADEDLMNEIRGLVAERLQAVTADKPRDPARQK